MQLCKIWGKKGQGREFKAEVCSGVEDFAPEHESGHIPPQNPLSREGISSSTASPWLQLSEYSHSSPGDNTLPTGCSFWQGSHQKKEKQAEQQSVEEEGRGGQGNTAPVTQRGLEKLLWQGGGTQSYPNSLAELVLLENLQLRADCLAWHRGQDAAL